MAAEINRGRIQSTALYCLVEGCSSRHQSKGEKSAVESVGKEDRMRRSEVPWIACDSTGSCKVLQCSWLTLGALIFVVTNNKGLHINFPASPCHLDHHSKPQQCKLLSPCYLEPSSKSTAAMRPTHTKLISDVGTDSCLRGVK